MASLEKRGDKKKTSLRANKRSTVLKYDSKPGSSGSKPSKSLITNFLKVLSKKQIDQNGGQNEFQLNITPQSKKTDVENGTLKAFNKLACKRKKDFSKLRGSYHLRSLGGGRVLRSRLNTSKCNTLLVSVNTPENLVPRPKKRGKKKVKKFDQDELSRIKKHFRYMLKRMNYEQSLIDAYSGEGWKGQSAEKIRPEKELGRAKSEILRCKLKIREIFQHLDSLLAEGRLHESLFDTDGIDSENIFCGKCGSKEVSTENDIILCDGVCERGFHQNCLNPPLLSEDIPSGDEGWLCPECDCKLEFIDLLNEFLEKDISFEDSWERIFPEAAALVNGNGQYDDLPLDDSEDDDYNPAQKVGVNEQVERSGCEESDSSSSSCGSRSSDNTGQSAQATVELSTDDSEDEDYDPDAINSDKEIQKTKSSSDESDFTSDSDAFCIELRKSSHVGKAPASSQPTLDFFNDSVRENMKDEDTPLDDSELLSPMLEVEKQESGLRSSNKRDRERLDYKKLYDEAYGKSSTDSSEDEDWSVKSTPKKLMKIDDDEEIEDSIHTVAKTTQKLKEGISSISASEKVRVPPESHSSSYSSTHRRKYGIANKKKLYEAFRESQYPTKERKESLAQELGMTLHQVTKWFGNVRHSSTAASTPPKATDSIRTAEEKPYKKILNEAFQENRYPSKGKKEELAQELGMTCRQVSRWFESARRNFHVSVKKSSDPLTSCSDKAEAPDSDMLDIGAAEMTPGEVTQDKATITIFTRNSSPDRLEDRIILIDSSRDKVATLEGCTSFRKPEKGIDLESPGIPTTDTDASIETEKKVSVAFPPKSESKGSKESKGEEDDRQNGIAKELRRMRAGR